jgi:hypothetical protein
MIRSVVCCSRIVLVLLCLVSHLLIDANSCVGVFLESTESAMVPGSTTTLIETTLSTIQSSTGKTALQQLKFSLRFQLAFLTRSVDYGFENSYCFLVVHQNSRKV